MSSSNGGNDARDGLPEAGGRSEQEVREEQDAAMAIQAENQGDQSPGEGDHHMDVVPNSEFMQDFDVEGIIQSLDETHGYLGDQRQDSGPSNTQHPADKSPTQEPDPKQARMDVTKEAAASGSQVPNLPYPLVDALIFKDAIPNLETVDLADMQAHMMGKIGPRYKLVGAVAHFYHIHSYVDNGLVDERQGRSATVDACADESDWYSVQDIAGVVIGCDPQEVNLLTEPVWTYITGLIGQMRVGPYPIVGLYTGIDLMGIQPEQFETAKEFEEAELLLARDQGTAFARFAALAARYHLSLTICANERNANKASAYEIVFHLLQQTPGFSRTHRICFSEFMYFPHQAERFLKVFPNTVFGITHEYIASLDRESTEWLKTVPCGN